MEGGLMAKTKRPIKAEDLYEFRLITDSRISPDGRFVVYSLERVDRKAEKRYTNLWVVPVRGEGPRQFTFGDHVDRLPRWAPDGRSIAFLSDRQGAKQFQIYIIPLAGGEARPLTRLRGTFGTFEWSPDGRWIAFDFREKPRDAAAREGDTSKPQLGVVAHTTDRVFYKLDGSGLLPNERWHIWKVSARGGRPNQLTAGARFDERSPAWAPGGRSIVCLSNRTGDPDLKPEHIDICMIPASGGRLKRVSSPTGMKFAPGFSPDGRCLAYYGIAGQGRGWKNVSLWVVPASGRGRARNLTGRFDLDVTGITINDLEVAPPAAPPTWSADGKSIYFAATRHGNGPLYSLSADGKGSPTAIVDEPGVVLQFSMDRSASSMAYLFGDMAYPVDLFVGTLPAGNRTRLTSINSRILKRVELGCIEDLEIQGPGGTSLHGWIMKPPSFAPRRKYPSILEIHGGPQVQYGNLFMHEFYFLAAQGYVIHFCNPRGSQGYGENHCRAIWGRWGEADYADLMAWTDWVSKQPYIDRHRMGVTGGSYGGFMTNWIIGHTSRFKAAVTQRSIANMISKYGSGDYNWMLEYRFGGKPPWESPQRYWQQSPLKYFGHAKTPTLVVHSEQDHRCPIEQGEQTYVALKVAGVDTEMVRFPEEPHGLSRTGRTDRRIQRLRHILRWFDRYLK
jgi:dipeptidyl aminopeptidase/acylaminoacyl peptidase